MMMSVEGNVVCPSMLTRSLVAYLASIGTCRLPASA